MVTSTQLTNKINQQANPREAMFQIWMKTRYLVAQKPAAADYDKTKPGYFKGKMVIPGPKADAELSDVLGISALNINDFETMMNRHYIRFVDNRTTENADDSVRRALYTVMTSDEADAYEQELRKYYANKRQRVPS